MHNYSERNQPSDLADLAQELRQRDLDAVYNAGAGHIGGEMSVMDILTALYFDIAKVNTENPLDPNRDRIILSKGHAALALYVVLAEKGFLSNNEVSTFLQPGSRLSGHPDCTKIPGVETNTGPLGHGLPVGVGMAIAAKLDSADWRTFVVVGDGELQEGSNWEAVMAAAHHGLDNLVLIVDHNRLQQGARLEDTNNIMPLAPKFAAFEWDVEEINGHNIAEICESLSITRRVTGKPKCIIAKTNKGQGIRYMTDRVEWHHKVPNRQQYIDALDDLKMATRVTTKNARKGKMTA